MLATLREGAEIVLFIYSSYLAYVPLDQLFFGFITGVVGGAIIGLSIYFQLTKNMSEGEIKIDVKDRQINCQVCYEDKIVECFYTFRCGHSVCKDCYKKMKDKERCYYCRQEIMDEKMVEKYKISLWTINLMMLFDMFYVAFLFIITGESSKKLVILFCVDEVYSMLILMVMILNGFESVSTIYNILTCIVKSVWIIMMFVVKI